jgi:hypothetical protein
MKQFLTLTLALGGAVLLSAQGAARQPAPQTPLLIEPHRIGKVAVGALAEDVYEAFSPDQRRLVDLGLEGQLSPALELTFPGGARRFSVVAELECTRELTVWRIYVRDPAFRTAKGIGVGSTVAQLRAAYALGPFSTEEGGAGVVVESLSATFELDQSRVDLTHVRTAAELPGAVKVIGVLLWK